MKKLLFLSIVQCCFILVKAQGLPPIQTDRPDQTECPFTTPKNHVQIEFGMSNEKTSNTEKYTILPTILWKYGFNERFEFRLITEASSYKSNSAIIKGLTPVKVGFKAKLMEENGIIPHIGFIGHLEIPSIASKRLKTTYYAPSFRFTMQHTITNNVSFSYNLGAEWNGETPEPSFIYTVTSGFSLSDKLGAYIELYGFAPQKSKSDHRADGGFTYLISPNVQFDISGGFGISKNAPKHYGAIGISVRLPN
jgi:hypothetical protein